MSELRIAVEGAFALRADGRIALAINRNGQAEERDVLTANRAAQAVTGAIEWAITEAGKQMQNGELLGVIVTVQVQDAALTMEQLAHMLTGSKPH